jgi:hypothetical protein
MAWRRVLQARGSTAPSPCGVGAAWRQPTGSPRQSLPAVNGIAWHFSGGAALHRPPGPPQPVQLRHQRPSAALQVLQVAVAVERPPVDAARPAAPVAGLRGARTGSVGPRPAGAAAALVEPRAGRDGDLPGPTRLPAGHEPSPPLAWLPGSDQPTTRSGTAKPEPHGKSTVRSGGRDCRARSGCGERPEGATAGASSTAPPENRMIPEVRACSTLSAPTSPTGQIERTPGPCVMIRPCQVRMQRSAAKCRSRTVWTKWQTM